jgi:hypothetical protein
VNAYITADPGWMKYALHADCYPKPKRITFRNHGNSYIKDMGEWVRVYFNYNFFPDAERIPMRINSDSEWEMANEAEY